MLLIHIFILIGFVSSEDNLNVISSTTSTFLEKYRGYTNAVVMHFKIPEDAESVSFKFVASEVDMSIFGCYPKDITLYLKYGAPPVINPDGSKFPNGMLTYGRSHMESINFKSNKKSNYINITSPYSGSYYAAVFQSYTDPNSEGITQEGLTPECYTSVEATLYAKLIKTPTILTNDTETQVILKPKNEIIYKFYVPKSIDTVIISLKDIIYCTSCYKLISRVQSRSIPTEKNFLKTFLISNNTFNGKFWAEEESWYYITFNFESNDTNIQDNGQFMFLVKYISNIIDISLKNQTEITVRENLNSRTFSLYSRAEFRSFMSENSILNNVYKQYDLIRGGNTESFLFSFDLNLVEEDAPPLFINLTSIDFTVLKYKLFDTIDMGGTMQFTLAFKPRIKKEGIYKVLEKEPKNHIIVACISNKKKLIPTWPNKCVDNGIEYSAPVIVNSTSTNMSVLVPYPESGFWYISMKLFCGQCEPCDCSEKCKQSYIKCVEKCEFDCKSPRDCKICRSDCERNTLNNVDGCVNCDCDGPCKSSSSCNTSVLFDVSSMPCVRGSCGNHGRCMFMVAEGFVYSSCYCLHNYRGWDCTDDTMANSLSMIILELALLVLSNIIFIPAIYISYKRGYRVEPLVYLATCFFSTFYHACDAGEGVISFCIFKLSVLQFSDFYSALLSIWVTLIAMAYLNTTLTHALHMTGAILIAFGTTYKQTSLWVFLLPTLIGIGIIIVNWYIKCKKLNLRFPGKKYLIYYLPVGVTLVIIALLCFALLQTKKNYKYIHSLWHILMGAAIIILLPDEKNFLPKTLGDMS